jgi:hypothetical protein
MTDLFVIGGSARCKRLHVGQRGARSLAEVSVMYGTCGTWANLKLYATRLITPPIFGRAQGLADGGQNLSDQSVSATPEITRPNVLMAVMSSKWGHVIRVNWWIRNGRRPRPVPTAKSRLD